MTIEITTKLPAKQRLAEIYQSMAMKQALLKRISSSLYERITPFVLCRDFLVDVYSFSIAKKDFNIYGMSFQGSTNTPDYTGVYLLVHFPNQEAKDTFDSHLSILKELEKNNKIPPTEVHYLSGLEALVVGNKNWLHNCLTLSLYTFLLRVMCYKFSAKLENWFKVFGELNNTDSKYVKSVAEETWSQIQNDLSLLSTEDFCGFEVSKTDTYKVHHNSGFISVFGSHTEQSPAVVKQNTHWKTMQAKGLRTEIT